MTWKQVCTFWIVVSAVLAFLLGWVSASGAELKLYDAMSFEDKPASEKLGCIHFPGLYQWALHGGAANPNKDYSKPDGKHYRELAQAEENKGTTIAWLNLEAWNYDLRLGPATAAKRMQNRLTALALVRAEASAVDWMAYNWGPDNQSLYWSFATDCVPPDRRLEWRRWNERYAKPVLQAQTAIFPSCYLRRGYSHTLYRRINGNLLGEIERLAPDKPIYPFVRLRYTNKKFVEPERLRQALEYLRGLGVDGFAIWSGPWPWAKVPWETPEIQALWAVIREVADE